MLRKLKLALAMVVALLVAVAGGWIWGASGRRAAEQTLQTVEVRNDLLEAWGQLLDAQISVDGLNFGNAVRTLEEAKGRLGSVRVRLKDVGREDDQKQIDVALAAASDAQRMAGQLDRGATSRAADAAKIVAQLLGTGPIR